MSKNLKNKEYKVQQHSIQIVFKFSLKINFNQTKKSLTKSKMKIQSFNNYRISK